MFVNRQQILIEPKFFFVFAKNVKFLYLNEQYAVLDIFKKIYSFYDKMDCQFSFAWANFVWFNQNILSKNEKFISVYY